MTEVLTVPTVPAARPGGAVRRFALVGTSVVAWVAALFCFGTVGSPGVGEPKETGWRAVALLLITLPALRRVRRLFDVVLAVAAGYPRPELPPFETWAGPERMFRRLQWSAYSYVAIPLLVLVGFSVAGFVLAEPVAGVVFLVLSLIPLLFAVVAVTLPRLLRAGVRAGLEAGQVVALRVAGRVDKKRLLNDACLSWFDGVLPDGQHVTVRTPLHYAWAGDARGVVDAPDLVLVLGRGGYQGLLLSPGRPEDAVWLLGPVPLVRVPRSVQKAFVAQRG